MKIAEILNTKSNSEWAHLIDEWVKSERDREIVRRRLLDHISVERLAEENYLSVSQIKRVVNKWCAIMIQK